MEPQPVAIVIVTWNSATDIRACLDAALAQCPQEVVIVDNGSADDTVGVVQDYVTDRNISVRLIELAKNIGFAGGSNIGVRETSAPFVLFLNDDAILRPGYIATLVAAFEHRPDAASAVGKLVYHSGGKQFLDSAGIDLRRWALSAQDRGHGEVDCGQYDDAEDIFGPSGAAALFRREALTPLGPGVFDETFFAYYEDVDLAWRLSRHGWTHLYVPTALAEHDRRGPGTKPTDIAARAFINRYLVFAKNESLLRFSTYAPVAGLWETLRLVRRAFTEPAVLIGVPASLPRILEILIQRSKSTGNNGP